MTADGEMLVIGSNLYVRIYSYDNQNDLFEEVQVQRYGGFLSDVHITSDYQFILNILTSGALKLLYKSGSSYFRGF